MSGKEGAPAAAELERLTAACHAEALAARGRLAELALEARNVAAEAAGRPAFAAVGDYVADLSRRTVCLTLLAGSGSRWAKSLVAARERGEAAAVSFDPAAPRGLFPVRDFLGLSGPAGSGRVAIAAYALAAFRGLGRHLLVVRGWQEQIDAAVLRPLGIAADDRDFFTQDAPFGKPLGHGDAAWQCRVLWEGGDYVLANFAGDASSRLTAMASLLVLDALNVAAAAGSRPGNPARSAGRGPVDLLVPAARIAGAAYPIELDDAGLPRSFGHAKLSGRTVGVGSGYTNVGVRVYRAAALREKVLSFRGRFWEEGRGYAIPGNDPEGREFALDNVDAELAAEGRARILAAALPEELAPAKCLGDVPAFERAIERVIAADSL